MKNVSKWAVPIQIIIILLAWIAVIANNFAIVIAKSHSLEVMQQFQFFLIFVSFLVIACSFAKGKIYTAILCAIPFALHVILFPIGSYENNAEYVFMLISNYFSLLLLPLLFVFKIFIKSDKKKHLLVCLTTVLFYLISKTQMISNIFTLHPPLTITVLLEAFLGASLIFGLFYIFCKIMSKAGC